MTHEHEKGGHHTPDQHIHPQPVTQIRGQIDLVHHVDAKLLDLIRECLCGRRDSVGHMTISVTSVQLGNKEVPLPGVDHALKFKLPTTSQSVGLSVVGPKLPSGAYATGLTWKTSDSATVPLQAVPDSIVTQADPAWVDLGDGSVAPQIPVLDANGNQIPCFNVLALTPQEPPDGTEVGAIVTASAPGMADSDIEVAYGNPELGHMAITATAVPES